MVCSEAKGQGFDLYGFRNGTKLRGSDYSCNEVRGQGVASCRVRLGSGLVLGVGTWDEGPGGLW